MLSMPKTASPSGLLSVSSSWLTIAPASPWASTVTVRPDGCLEVGQHLLVDDERVVGDQGDRRRRPRRRCRRRGADRRWCPTGWLEAAAPARAGCRRRSAQAAAVAAASAATDLTGASCRSAWRCLSRSRGVRHGFRWERTFLRRHDPDQVRRSRTSCPALSPAHRTPVSRSSLRRRGSPGSAGRARGPGERRARRLTTPSSTRVSTPSTG